MYIEDEFKSTEYMGTKKQGSSENVETGYSSGSTITNDLQKVSCNSARTEDGFELLNDFSIN